MLNEHDRLLVSREHSIPGFRYLLQPDELRKLLCTQPGVSDPGELKSGYLRYKPGMNCIARYEFEAGGERRYAYAKAFGDDAGEKLAKVREKANGWSPLGPGRVTLNEQQILFSVFPHDSKLHSVERLSAEEARKHLLTRLFKSKSGWESATFETLNYKPERRHVARFMNPDGDFATVKFYSRKEFARVREFHKHFQASPGVQFPDWIGGSKTHRALAFSWLPGVTLRDLKATDIPEATRRAGAAIAHFHAGTQPRFKKHDAVQAARQTIALADNLAMLLPEEAAHARDLARALAEWHEGISGPEVPVHGDFYDKQVVAGNHGVALIDSDNAHIGHPTSDVACFIAHIERHAISGVMPAGAAAARSVALLEGYREVNTAPDLSQLGLHTAFYLFKLIHHPFRDRVQDWPEQTRSLLARATELFEAG